MKARVAPCPRPLRAALLLAALLAGRAASADVSDADKATARRLAQEGQDAVDAKDYATAVDRFHRADALVHAPTLQLALARAQLGLGQLVSAAETLHRIAREDLAPGAPAVWTKAVADARKELEALEPRVPGLVVQVAGAPAARVTIDGVPVPDAALGVSRAIDPGTHVVRAQADGFAPAEEKVTIAEREQRKLTLTLRPPVPGVAPPPVPAPAGRPGAVQRTVGFALIGGGGAGIVIGAITGGLAVSKHSALAAACPTGHCVGQQDAIDGYHAVANASTASFLAGLALAGAGVAVVLTAPKEKAAAVVPVVGAGWAGIQGRFR